jgi:hypothetical protein
MVKRFASPVSIDQNVPETRLHQIQLVRHRFGLGREIADKKKQIEQTCLAASMSRSKSHPGPG